MRKHLLTAAAVLALGAGTLGLGAVQARAAGELHIYNWGNYTNPELIKSFEKKYDVKVTLDDYDSNEMMLAKIKGGAAGYDIVVPSDYMVSVMAGEGLLEKTEPNQMANFKNINPKWIEVYWDKGRHYTVPWQWGTTAFTVDTAVYKGDVNTLKLELDPPPELKGRINMLNDMNEVINAGLRYLGYPRCNSNKEQLKELSDLLIKAKASWRTMDYATIEKLTSGDVDLSQNWNGAAMRARAQRPTLKYAYPKEGFTGWMDNVAVLKGAPNLENAKLFQNFVMDPENAALISNFARYANGIKGSEKFMDKDMVAAPEIIPPAGTQDPEFVPPCDQKVVDLYNRIWTNLKK
ncbi:spermidine/putrescine transport system substrate-binding protein [Tistlia consotensis]|uniref:Putrescine-binding periplasmic protein n=1 Tax=Tistlia consotensis USBA 355 TaxID=560819 RepID=A0A1Y6CNJ4_9PROT|nr:extracellular solute-binding protein [Tistlia consotensis]SMF65251.1 spermidine/putrescine transport system substrate-binding protein [Tistlia consotensis USBA 355]SNS03921.1 spermidine/putrescine transport system substrate-binding protein [Tistlia consotensis]